MKFNFGFEHILYAIAAICFAVLFWFSPIVAVTAAAACVFAYLHLQWKRIKRDLAKRLPCPRCASLALKDESAKEVYAGPDVIVRRSEIPQILRCDSCAAWFEKKRSGTYEEITGEVAEELEKFWGAAGRKSKEV